MAREKETFRSFIASFVEDHSSFKNYNEIIDSIEKDCQHRIRWVGLNNVHLTWKFLGNITESRTDRIVKALEPSLKLFKPMSIVFDKVQIWPDLRSPRQLVWLGWDRENNVSDNFALMDKALVEAGFSKEKRSFKPHITLGRFKLKEKLKSPVDFHAEQILPPLEMRIDKIVIVRSRLLPTGPIYETTKELSLI